MPNLWLAGVEGVSWAVSPLAGNAYALSGRGLSAAEVVGSNGQGAPSVLLVRRSNGSGEQWLLLARKYADVQVNGTPLALGVRLLCDRDEINVRDRCSDDNGSSGALRCFYSAERLAQVVAYPGKDAVCCPRCKQMITPGQMAVQCPGPSCGAWHHQLDERSCRAGNTPALAALCTQPTELGGACRWSPDEL